MFLKGLPEDHGMVLVLVQHLDPDHVSLMPELVANKTKSPVHSVEDNMAVEPGHIYLIPPGYEMELRDGHLRLEEFKSPRGLRRPIDRFFRSLARECGESAVAVVLSGTGSDGADGAREDVFAERFLRTEKITYLGGSLGGESGRRIEYWPHSGRARQILFAPTAMPQIPVARPVRKPDAIGDVELF